jgi:hydroxymethylpyrimidine pyrophosphatase-like HAD family hydrolase
MVHEPIPENHRFAYHDTGSGNPDFLRRIGLYEGHCRPLGDRPEEFGPAAQLLAVVPSPGARETAERLRERLSGFSVIRATSPLDGDSLWLEVFAPGVSKSGTVAWLAEREGVEAGNVLAVGNDYNDLDLLEWAGTAFVVANAPEELRARFPEVPGHDDGGVAAAVSTWLADD